MATTQPIDFALTASFYVKEECDDFVDAHAAAAMIRDRFPDATIDWQRGRQSVEARIERLRSMGAPEVILESSKHALDTTVYVGIPSGDSLLEGCTTGFSYHDGCIGLDCVPFDIDAIKQGAQRFAERMGFDFELSAGSVGDINLTVLPGNMSPEAAIARRFHGLNDPPSVIEPIDNWEARLSRGVTRWFAKHPEQRYVQRWLSDDVTAEAIADALLRRMQSIGDANTAFRATKPDGKWSDNLVVAYDGWVAAINLPGVPETLFA